MNITLEIISNEFPAFDKQTDKVSNEKLFGHFCSKVKLNNSAIHKLTSALVQLNGSFSYTCRASEHF